MPFSIAFVGVDGAGKTTLIKKVTTSIELPTSHMNRFSKRLYTHQHSKAWECINLFEIMSRNIIWKYRLKKSSMIMDRCYICSLVYSNLEGFPEITHCVKHVAVKPTVICLIEPVEEIVENAYMFSREYFRVLQSEGYQPFYTGRHPFGRLVFFKQPETQISSILDLYINYIGTLS